jgi:hypothetical protein
MNTPMPSSTDRKKTSQIPGITASAALVGPLIPLTIMRSRKRLFGDFSLKKR